MNDEQKAQATNGSTDVVILAKHDRAVGPRARMELAIVNQLLSSLREHGYSLTIVEYVDDDEKIDYADDDAVKLALFNLDDAHVNIYGKDDDGSRKRIGWVYFVFGNDGYDAISDYSTSLDAFLKPCNELADRLAGGLE